MHASTTAPADKDFLPGPVLLLGAPGVGKGTQAKMLMAAYGIPQISTGDILRANISSGTTLGKMAKALVDQGTLVSDELVNQMVADRLSQPDTRRGYILDGFPRTLNQATWLDAQLDRKLRHASRGRHQHRGRLRAAAPPHHRPPYLVPQATSTTSTRILPPSLASVTSTVPLSSSAPTTPKPSSQNA